MNTKLPLPKLIGSSITFSKGGKNEQRKTEVFFRNVLYELESMASKSNDPVIKTIYAAEVVNLLKNYDVYGMFRDNVVSAIHKLGLSEKSVSSMLSLSHKSWREYTALVEHAALGCTKQDREVLKRIINIYVKDRFKGVNFSRIKWLNYDN
jgi:hypothetical protein